MAMSTFHRFVDLPYDVRMLVWEYYALPAPDEPSRVVHINNWRHCFTSTPAPAIMHVCHDARIVGLRHYRPSFACCATLKQRQKLDPQIDHTCRIPIWVNFNVDTVKMSLHFFFSDHLLDRDFDLIQRLQLTSDDDAYLYIEYSLGHFNLPRLKSLDIFHDGDMNTWYGQIIAPYYCEWGCNIDIIRVIGKGGTEILDLESDEKWYEREHGLEQTAPSEDEWDSDDNWKPGDNH